MSTEDVVIDPSGTEHVSAYPRRTVWQTESACVARIDSMGEWSAVSDGYMGITVDKAIERARSILIGRYGWCDVISVTTSPVNFGQSVWLFVTVIAELKSYR